MTIVLQVPVVQKMKIENSAQWAAMANATVLIFAQNANFEKVLGKQQPCESVPAGYKVGYTYGEHSSYMCLAFNPYQYSMGVIVKFSAEALAYYLQHSGLKVYEFLQQVQSSSDYDLRISRIDVDLEFLEPKFTVAKINKQLKRTVEVCTQKTVKGKKIMARKPLQLRGFEANGEIKTLYIGSPASDTELRIYHKGKEQISRKGFRLETALKHPKWIRFEAVFRGDYAHQLTEKMLQVSSDKQLSDLIVNVFLQKYYFRYRKSKRPTAYTLEMKKMLHAVEAPLLPLVADDKAIEKKINYIMDGSGAVGTFYVVKQLWGDDALAALLQYIYDEVQEWEANYSTRRWLTRHGNDTLKTYPKIDDLLKKI